MRSTFFVGTKEIARPVRQPPSSIVKRQERRKGA
jgi:hypothetical protein